MLSGLWTLMVDLERVSVVYKAPSTHGAPNGSSPRFINDPQCGSEGFTTFLGRQLLSIILYNNNNNSNYIVLHHDYILSKYTCYFTRYVRTNSCWGRNHKQKLEASEEQARFGGCIPWLVAPSLSQNQHSHISQLLAHYCLFTRDKRTLVRDPETCYDIPLKADGVSNQDNDN
ncbi:hypothetical protein GLAREA_11245 [Glarea lozoyensis ATCC 20868]|uniref:Uncharacterized protein n=1 Tax=Glarea lozoyensis (strain ATCC 20868 / MF5171) TaxID=1116229 RepID=S3DUA6_GLAL2|nr:uncharacterized protein GLAREA_11245 [Glarea lozoyensis ATCC 20868]EPE35546.1 hypothetical protein GLAREA_11245 [Glarea lozoyensis ATCC 20868]